MKPAPEVPGNTAWERLDSAARIVFSVTKEEFTDKEAQLKKKRLQKKRAKKK